jgi:hypothetical protein
MNFLKAIGLTKVSCHDYVLEHKDYGFCCRSKVFILFNLGPWAFMFVVNKFYKPEPFNANSISIEEFDKAIKENYSGMVSDILDKSVTNFRED